jgi:hypothetical protein
LEISGLEYYKVNDDLISNQWIDMIECSKFTDLVMYMDATK